MNGASTHTWLRRVSDYHSGGVSATERAAVEAHLAGCAECRQALATYRRFYTLARSPLQLGDSGDGPLTDYRALTHEDAMIANDSDQDITGSTTRRRPRVPLTALGTIAAILVITILAGAPFLAPQVSLLLTAAPTRTPTPGQFTTGAFELVPLATLPNSRPWLMPSPRDGATAYTCASPPQPAPTGAESPLWVTHNAGQTWSRVALPAGSNTGCDVEPAFDGSHRVAISIFTDAPKQNAQACADTRFYLSDDDGATWRSIALTSLAPLPPSISQGGDCFMVVSARHLFLDIVVNLTGGQSQSIFERSDDDGGTWQRADHGLEALHVAPLQQAPWFALPLDATGETLVTTDGPPVDGSAHTDLWITRDVGAHWQRITADKAPDPSFDLGLPMTEPASADAARACHCVVLVNGFNALNQRSYAPLNKRLYSSRDLVHWTALPPLPVKGTSAQFSGVYRVLGLTGDGRLLAVGPDPDADLSAQSYTNGPFTQSPPALWLWDTHTGRWNVARTQLPCVDPQNCYDHPYDNFGVSVSAGAPGQPPGTWFWIAISGGPGSGQYFRVFIPAA
jgi:hypothetical protein